MPAPVLEVKNLGKRFGDIHAVDGVTLTVAAGELFGLLGPNGAGKTTLLSIISSLLEADRGEVRILGRVLRRQDRNLRRSIGIVPQELAVYGELSARENLLFFGELYGLRGRALEQRVDDLLAAVGLEDRGRQRAGTFSGGMKRRLNLAAGLVHGPDLVLLDEPTTGVDPQSRNRIFEEVRRLNAAGVTIVYTSHYMEEVQALCPRVGIIDHGRLIACDVLPELLKKLAGLVRFRAAALPEALLDSIARLDGGSLAQRPDGDWELTCGSPREALLQLVSWFSEHDVALTKLEIEEPNLERVFLHLTGRGLRD
ncbi:MAG: ABC transporter ATP-binding protein [Planctomycetes bacterium]|nr:ABC transporter ATP-binding protein [Planctomycetota bacterium]